MKTFTRIFGLLLMVLVIAGGQSVRAQSVLNPADTLVTYNPAAPPAVPFDNNIHKWVRTVRLPWNTTPYKAYIYNGCQFRLCFPLTYNPTAKDGKLYPMMIFDHGEGEAGTVYDNEYSLYHGGQIFENAVAAGTFDGYILVMQTTGGFGTQQYVAQRAIIDYMITNNKLDPFRVTGNGLSGGGAGIWGFFTTNPTYNAGIIPMSADAIQLSYTDTVNLAKYTPIWNIHGGLDNSPAPSTSAQVLAAFAAAGANYVDLDMTTQGHDTWDSTWSMPAFWPWLLSKYCSNPWTLFGQTLFCPGTTPNVTIGLAPGFQAYQWELNGVLQPQWTTNSIHVTANGTYSARVERNGNWSLWSPVPVVIGVMPPTVAPPITVAPGFSSAIPDVNGNGTTLTVPANYVTYAWEKSGSSTVIGTGNTLPVSTAGGYAIEVTQLHGCSSSFGPAFTVINAKGPNPPDPGSNLIATPLGLTSIVLNWSQNPNPVINNTGFEVWQTTKPGTPYTLIGVTGQDIALDTVKNLTPGTTYYYEVRALGTTAASAVSNQASATTGGDTQAPTAPGNLVITGTTSTSISLSWKASTDNIGVVGYYIYINGAKSYSTTGTTFPVDGLVYPQSYDLVVKAFDAAGNISVASNQVSGEATQKGIIPYQTYELSPSPTVLPNFNSLAVTSSGTATSISTLIAPQSTNYGLLWQGYIIIPTTGSYSFRTASVDGSEIWLGNLGGIGSPYLTGTAIVVNDGLHTSKTVTSSAMTLTAGVYPIAIAYFYGTAANGRASLTVSWETPTSKGAFATIPGSSFGDVAVTGPIPVAPTNLVATSLSYNQIGLTWADTTTVATGFEIWRSTSATTGFAIVNTVGANATSFTDGTASSSTQYYYEVRALGQYGQSAYSAVANATTAPLPPAPSVPYNFAAVSPSPTTAKVSWTDSTANVTGYQLYRSNNNDQSYVQIASIPAGTTSYTDASLFSNAMYYYKVTATNVGGVSASPAEVKLTTLDNLPVIANIGNLNARYGVTTTVNVSATTVNTGGLKLTASTTLPTFGSFVDNGNETGTLTFNPGSGNVGNYPGLYIVATDTYGGTDTAYFSLSVNNFYSPVIGSLSNITMNEGDTLTVPLTATDQNSSDTLSLSASGGPNSYTVTPTGNGTANLFLHPSYAAAGTYKVTVTAHDNNGLNTTGTFVLTVNYKNPNTKIFTRVSNGDPTALGAPWNPLQGTTTNNLLDSTGNTTSVGLSFTPSTWWNTSNDGSPTGNNSGVYPDVVLKDYMWFGAYYGGPNTISGTVTGLDPSSTYTLTFFSSSTYNGVTNNGTTTYTVGSQTVSLNVQDNQHNTASISNIQPQTGGVIPFTLGLGTSTVLGYFNALVITKQYNDGTPPAGASGLTAQATTGAVLLNWKDSAYNATGYQIWRAPASTGVFSQIGTAAGNSAAGYVDSSITAHTQYLYTVDAYNSNGQSGNSDTASVTTLTRLPKITAIANVTMVDTQSVTINVTTSDDPTAQLTLTAANLPPFASFTDNGNGTGVLTLTPSAGTVGVYPNVSVTVTDQYDSTASTSFTVAVTEPNVQSVYLNFTGGLVSPAPWNSMTSFPLAGTVMSNLTDGGGNPTTISATLLDGFTQPGSTGWVTGNSDAIYPQSVVQNFFYLYNSGVTTSRIQISGLNNAKLYNFVFFNSQWDGTPGMTYYTINGVTDSLQADWNINKTVQINGIKPVSGVVTIGVSKGPKATVAYINSIVIQGYDSAAGTLLNPTGLIATAVTQTTVSLRWQDRSAIATGYEVWRASDATGSYSLIATLPANAVTYQDTKLTKGANYYYVVQAVDGANSSNYSNVLAVTTYTDAVYIAVNNTPAAPKPWNNLNSPGGQGYTWSNFLDSTGVGTSMGLLQTGIFAGANSLGDVTGNNSGVYPDPVLEYQYVLFAGNLGGFTLSGLDLAKVYDLTFMGSEDYETGNQNTAYIVNGDTVWLNALYNQTATVTMRGVKPDQFGNIYMQFISYQQALAGWVNSIVVDGYTPVPRNAPAPPAVTGGSNSTAMWSSPTALVAQTQTVNTDTVASAYPNPFHTTFTLQVPADYNNENVMVAVYDMKGELVYRKEFDGLVQGENFLMVESDRNFAGTGVYVVKLMYSDGKTVKTVKLLKQ
jgi:large repetitive protein